MYIQKNSKCQQASQIQTGNPDYTIEHGKINKISRLVLKVVLKTFPELKKNFKKKKFIISQIWEYIDFRNGNDTSKSGISEKFGKVGKPETIKVQVVT